MFKNIKDKFLDYIKFVNAPNFLSLFVLCPFCLVVNISLFNFIVNIIMLKNNYKIIFSFLSLCFLILSTSFFIYLVIYSSNIRSLKREIVLPVAVLLILIGICITLQHNNYLLILILLMVMSLVSEFNFFYIKKYNNYLNNDYMVNLNYWFMIASRVLMLLYMYLFPLAVCLKSISNFAKIKEFILIQSIILSYEFMRLIKYIKLSLNSNESQRHLFIKYSFYFFIVMLIIFCLLKSNKASIELFLPKFHIKISFNDMVK